ncbi:MAG TPA: hypothetical protein VFG69_01380, partial [Nannocystaceae bacterium]|nr:hypothetical protein [Nannocystaceae bacterium]
GMLDSALITDTTNQIISVGVSDEIDDADLEKVGRDGSFLAPEAEDWAGTFAEIRQRVDQYPERSYLLAYCSSLTEGNPEVVVQVRKSDGEVSEGAACDFFPNYFGIDPLDTCTPELFANECETLGCGGITACGGCADDECCDGTSCTAPQTATELGSSCDSQTELCYLDGDVCPEGGTMCVPPIGMGDPCDEDNPCEPGVGFCSEESEVCEPTLDLGDPCGDEPDQCVTLHCDRTNPDNPLDVKVCQPPAEIYDSCGDQYGTCEIGSYCKGSACAARLREVESCADGSNCRRASCIGLESGGKICSGEPACFWSWDQKFPD